MENLDQSLSNRNILDESMSNVSGRFTTYSSTSNSNAIALLRKDISYIQNYINTQISALDKTNSDINSAKSQLSEAILASQNLQIDAEKRDEANQKVGIFNIILSQLYSKLDLINNDINSKKDIIKSKQYEISSLLTNKAKGASVKIEAMATPKIEKNEDVLEIKESSIPKDTNGNEYLDINEKNNNTSLVKKTSESKFPIKTVSIVLVVLGLTFGILKYKKII